MKKKSLATMVVTLALVAAVGVGATLAYLSSTTEVMKNTFTVGNVKITQDETDNDKPGEKTDTGNDYKDILPGDTLKKDPTVTVLANSADCYVYMQLTGADDLKKMGLTIVDMSRDWTKVDKSNTIDGVYRYKDVVKKSDSNQRLTSLFTQLQYDVDKTELKENEKLNDILIKSCAIQADHMEQDAADAAAIAKLSE